MFYNKLLQPAISVMNKLPFKTRIIISISFLFILLVAPSKNLFTEYKKKLQMYNSQIVGLQYANLIEDIIQTIQTHRGLTYGFLNGEKNFRVKIKKTEKTLNTRLIKLIDFDKNHLNILKHNNYFVEALSNLDLLKFNNFTKQSSSTTIFNQHSDTIRLLVKTFNIISQKTSFGTTNDMRINYLSHMLEDKLLLLEEYTGQLRGLGAGILAKKGMTKDEKKKLLSLYTLIKSAESTLMENRILKNTQRYYQVHKQTTLMFNKLEMVLDIVNKHMILSQKPNFDNKEFFKHSSKALKLQGELYRQLSGLYEILIEDAKNKSEKELALLGIGFLIILITAIYFFAALYHSVAGNLNKLKIASNMIANGKTNINLRIDAEDEIGDAIKAFNDMSKKLDKNIAFLDGYKNAIDQSSIVSKTDKRGVITYVNKMFCDLSGYSKKELVGYPHNIVRHPDMSKEAFKDLWKTIKAKKVWKGIIKNRRKDGSTYIVDATVIPILDSKGEIQEYVAVRHDITELEQSKEEIKRQKIDLLTSLPNRNQLLDDLKAAKKPLLLYLNIDDFASLNDFYGTKTGDKTLIHVAKIIKKIAAAANCKPYKLHTDEFMLYFESYGLSIQQYSDVFKEIIDYIEKHTINCDKQNCVSVTLSGGVASYEADEHFENLPNYTNIARKVAKSQNKKFLVYTAQMSQDDHYANNIEWINKIKSAIEDNRIVTFFQPIIDNKTNKITKYESLVRLIDKNKDVFTPFFFLDIAKKAKLYTKITNIMINKVFIESKKFPSFDFSVNIEVEDIVDHEISKLIFDKLQSHPHSDKIIFEITESQEIKDYDTINQFIKKVKSFGAKIAIDDFGSGYSNFTQILMLDADFIKIDGSIIKNIDTDESARTIAEAIIAFSKKLGTKTVVEFVHNQKVYTLAKALGADYSQGFYLGEPKASISDERQLAKSVS